MALGGVEIGSDMALCLSWMCSLAGAYRRESIYSGSSRFVDVMEQIYPEFSVDWKKYYNNTNYGSNSANNSRHTAYY